MAGLERGDAEKSFFLQKYKYRPTQDIVVKPAPAQNTARPD
jgi:hypothetical protein